MANGDGLMSIAMAENLDPLEKFALGFLSAAEQNQRKRYAEEAKFVREKTAQINERITKQRGLYAGMKEKKRGQISQLRAVMPGLSDEVVSTILRSDDETIENLIKDARKDFAQNRGSGREGKFLSFSDANGELFTGDPTIYDPRRKGSSIDELVNKQYQNEMQSCLKTFSRVFFSQDLVFPRYHLLKDRRQSQGHQWFMAEFVTLE